MSLPNSSNLLLHPAASCGYDALLTGVWRRAIVDSAGTAVYDLPKRALA
jgi:hypothetical protein